MESALVHLAEQQADPLLHEREGLAHLGVGRFRVVEDAEPLLCEGVRNRARADQPLVELVQVLLEAAGPDARERRQAPRRRVREERGHDVAEEPLAQRPLRERAPAHPGAVGRWGTACHKAAGQRTPEWPRRRDIACYVQHALMHVPRTLR